MKAKPLQLWLFDEPPVTAEEVEKWVNEHAKLFKDNWRFHYYVKHWRIPEKIQSEKEKARREHDRHERNL